MTATTLTTTAQQARALMVEGARGAAPVLHQRSREELLGLIEATQELINTATAAQQQALAHFAAIEDVRNTHTGEWIEQHRGLGRV